MNGFGTPYVVYLLYIVKLVVYSVGAALVISTTPGLGGLGDFGDWWTEPIVWQKLAVWTLLWEIIGLGCGSMPLTFRFSPMIGGILYWLRPGTVRLPPWPDKVPLTKGTTRTLFDVALYAGVLASALYLLLADGEEVAGPCGRPSRSGGDRGAPRLPRPARASRQGLVPRRPGRGLRLPARRLPLPDREPDRRLADRPLLHLVGRRVVEAQPPLPVRRLGDDLEHAVEQVADGEEARSGRTTPRTCARRRCPPSRRTSARSWSSRCRCSSW